MPEGSRRAVTAAMVRDVVRCERRVHHDLHTDPDLRDPVTAVEALLWRDGVAEIEPALRRLEGLVADLRDVHFNELLAATAAALVGPAAHVIGGRVEVDGMVGRPAILSRVDGRWVAGAFKSGDPLMPDGRRPRLDHAVEVGFEAAVLEACGLGVGGRAFVLDYEGRRTWYDLDGRWTAHGGTLVWLVGHYVGQVRRIIEEGRETRAADAPMCRLCRWRSICDAELSLDGDLTLVAGVDRAARGALEPSASTVTRLAELALDEEDDRAAPVIPGVSSGRLRRLRDRARILSKRNAAGYARAPLGIERAGRELHLCVDADPTRGGTVFIHGIWERVVVDGVPRMAHEHFLADGPDGERRAFAEALALLRADPDARLYVRSGHERDCYLRLQARYPDVCGRDEVVELFARPRAVDLFADLIEPLTEWPITEYAVETVAAHLGHDWVPAPGADPTSIAWHGAWLRDGDAIARSRIAERNRLRCMASALVLDALERLPLGAPTGVEPEAAMLPTVYEIEDGRAHDAGLHGGEPDAAGPADGGAALTLETRGEQAPVVKARPRDVPTLRPCLAIGTEGDPDEDRLVRRHAALTEELPLVGAEAMAPLAGGRFAATELLRCSAPWLEPAIAAVERSLRLSLWSGRPWLSTRPLLLVGPAGSGKSRFARSLGEAAGVACAVVDGASMSDALTLAGVARGWSSAMPCWPARVMAERRVANPLLFVDEIDKCSGSRAGNGGLAMDALLAMLEPITARAYPDRCLLADIDLSACCWIAAANSVDGLPGPLLSRFELVEIEPPGPEHFDALLAGIQVDLAARWGVPPDAMLDLPPRAVGVLRGAFARRRSARLLARHVEAVVAALGPARPSSLH